MIKTTIFPGRYVQGADALQRLGKELSRFGKKAFVICDPYVHENMLPAFRGSIEKDVEATFEKFAGESSDEEIERIAKTAKEKGCEMIAGIGGGKTIDTAKGVSHHLKLPCGIVPSIASTDAPCSALAVIYTPEGSFKRYLFLTRNPDLVLVDTKVVAQSPTNFLVSGMGDALATWFEAEAVMKGYGKNLTGDLGSMTAYKLARLCYDILLEYGFHAKSACDANVVTPALEHVVEANTLLSGLGFESGGLAAAHAIHNGLTVLEEAHKASHGEKVAFGTMASLFLTDKPQDVINSVYYFCESIDLPITLEGIGLGDISDDKLMKVAEAACAEGETIHNEPIPVTPERVVAAMKAADMEGRQRLGLV